MIEERGVIRVAIVVGDIVKWAAIAEHTPADVLLDNLERLWGELRGLIDRHNGTVFDSTDTFFAFWRLEDNPRGVLEALDFALAAYELVGEVGPNLDLRYPDGLPICMGWAVGEGPVVARRDTDTDMFRITGEIWVSVSRISHSAGRDGRAHVLATQSVRNVADKDFRFESPEDLFASTLRRTERVYTVRSRVTGGA